jgi:hypothetical protein
MTPGQQIGEVGCSGSCSGDHLHLEMWTPNWYDGGKPFDPPGHDIPPPPGSPAERFEQDCPAGPDAC